MINGNGFHYGRAIASYQPLHLNDDFTRNRAFFPQDVIAASQRPHVYLDPTTSQGGSLCLPFVYWNNALRIPQQDWRNMGQMNIRTINELKHANGATDNVTISVFAWAEEVTLSIPTAGEPGALSPQSGEKDEYSSGPISKPASIVSKVAGALKSVPGIGPYALATQMASNTIARIATMFGFSRPASLAEIEPYKPSYFGNLATTNMHDTSTKLALDCKQEVTVDPRVMGLGSCDEMAVKHIATRESYLTTFGWQVADTTESLLWNCFVNPMLWDNQAGGEVHLPACAFAAVPFKFWRGTMKYRFQIVASAFHKGRLKITYDPYYQKSNEYNVCYTHIIDLAKERDFTVDVGWGQGKSFLNVDTPDDVNLPFDDSVSIGPDTNNRMNGVLSVYVVNDLTIPNSVANNNIQVNVFVSAGDDIEFGNPSAVLLENISYFSQSGEIYEPQSGENHADSDRTVAESEPIKMMASDSMAADIDETDNTLMVFMGEPIVSMRQCLKRYNYHSYIPRKNLGRSWKTVRTGDFPIYRGYAPGAIHETAALVPYNYVKTVLLSYLTPAYTCCRGGLRWKYMRDGAPPTDSWFQVNRFPGRTGASYLNIEEPVITNGSGSEDQTIAQAVRSIPHTWPGAGATSVANNPVLELEFPYYSNLRFRPAKQGNKSTTANFNSFHTLSSMWDSVTGGRDGFHAYVSTAEDFTLGFFTGAPVIFIVAQNNDPPAKV
jgi:hypothetical protein